MKKLLDVFIYNWHYKLLAFLFAVFLWFVAANKEVTEAEINVELELIPTGSYRIIDYSPKRVILTVEGYRKSILELKEIGKIKYKLPKNLQIVNGRKFVVLRLQKRGFVVPNSLVKIKSVFPEYVNLKIEKLVEKALPVCLNVYGLNGDLKVKVTPNYVIALIPKKDYSKIKCIRTERIDLSDVKGNAEIFLPLVSNYKVEPNRVKLIIVNRN